MRLIPQTKDYGWTPYAWLVYLGFFFIQPVAGHAGWREWLATGLGTAMFLALYFTAYWMKRWSLVAVAGAIALLGVGFAPFNPGASVFFIFAASFVPFAVDARIAVRLLVVLVAIVGLEATLLHLPSGFWIPGVVISSLVGGVNIYYAERRCANAKLQMAHDEIEHLAKIAERERIARDLHDVLGHTLSVIILKSELASKLIERDIHQAKIEIAEVEHISRTALSEVRNAIGGYRTNGLIDEFTRAKATLETAGVSAECQSTQLPLTPPQETVLALVVREAVTNVVRHARAQSCQLVLAQTNGNCELRIQDDGRGGDHSEGNGLRGMRERIEALGGTLARESNPGTKLTITLPLQPQEKVSN